MQVEGQHWRSLLQQMATGGWVSNAYATYPLQGDSPKKFGLTPHNNLGSHDFRFKNLLVEDGHAFH